MKRFISWMLLGLHCFLLLQFILIKQNVVIDPEWNHQFFLLFIGLVAASSVQIFSKKNVFCLTGLFFSVVFAAIIAVPFRLSIGINLSLILILLLEGALYRQIVLLSASAAIFFLTYIFIPRPLTAWEMRITDTPLEIFITIIVLGGIIAAVIVKLIWATVLNTSYYDQLRRLKNAVEELSAANLGYNTFAQLTQHQATVEERNRITREIHDGIGYTLTNIIMLSEAAMDKKNDERQGLLQILDAVRVQAKTGLYDTRRALRLLRSKEAALPRGVNALRQMINIFAKATGIEVDLQILVSSKILEHSDIFLTIYRFVQEALTNSFRHGHAKRVEVYFYRSGTWIIIIVRDNGIGADAVQEGIGLQGMRERIEFIGGELDYSSAKTQKTGFTVTARIPIQGGSDENKSAVG